MNSKPGGRGRLQFAYALNLKHPIWPATRISAALPLSAIREWSVGQGRQTPNGRKLPGVHKQTSWGHWVQVRGRKDFFDEIVKLVSVLENHQDFLGEFLESGGTVTIDIQLPGDINIGDTISSHDLVRLPHLGINLSIEVFPSFA
jgi:hypothetical protein